MIHEQAELDRIHSEFGYYAHNNQPSHHVLYVAKKAGCNDVADKYLRKVMKQLYTSKGWCGDEDNGEMASWYVLSALGIFALEGAKDELVLGSPAVKHATVQLPSNKVLTVEAQNQADTHVYVKSVTWTPADGIARTIRNNVIKFTDLMQGGRLTFYMSASPNHAIPHSQNVDDDAPIQPRGSNTKSVQHHDRGQHTKVEKESSSKNVYHERMHESANISNDTFMRSEERSVAPPSLLSWFLYPFRLILGAVLVCVLVFVGGKYQAQIKSFSFRRHISTQSY
jgi:hypothetical protein